MSLHRAFHADLASSQISKRVVKEESGMAKYAKDTVYQELKKQARAKNTLNIWQVTSKMILTMLHYNYRSQCEGS